MNIPPSNPTPSPTPVVRRRGIYVCVLKPLGDIVAGTVLLVAAAPAMAILGLLLAVFQRGGVFFVQERPGRRGKPFRLVKFKTMNDARDAAGELLPDSQRTTWIGGLLRRTSLDELPQLFNVARGQLSLVGPRPLLMEYLEHYSPEQARRHEAMPGITGLAQVNGRNALTWEEKFELDVWYVDHVSFLVDLRILLKTAWKVFQSEGITPPEGMKEIRFKGSKHLSHSDGQS